MGTAASTAASPAVAPAGPAEQVRILTRDDFLGAEDVLVRRVPLPQKGYGGAAYVRTFDSDGRDAYDLWLYEHREGSIAGIRAYLVMLTACDEHGARLFTPEDLPALSRRNAEVMDALYEASQELNLLSKKTVDAAAGNSAAGPTSDSSSS